MSLSTVLLSAAGVGAAFAYRPSDAELVQLYGRPRRTIPRPPRVPLNAGGTLRDAAAAAGLFVGTALDISLLTNTSEPLYAATAGAEFNLFTAENDCKFGPTEPQAGQYTLDACIATAQWAASHNLSHRLHNTVWGDSNPRWLVDPRSNYTTAQLEGFMTDHVGHLITAFDSSSPLPAYCTDVVNEAVPNSGPDMFKPVDPWFPQLPTYVADAFVAARAASPSMKLFYNDYGAEPMNAKSDMVYKMVSGFVSSGVPIDGVGLQYHISVDAYPDAGSVSSNMARLVALGLEVHVTEMDVRCVPPCGADRLALQATIYGDVVQACLNNSKPTAASGKGGCKSVEVWGFTDAHTWLWSFENPTGTDVKPLPFDINYGKKPAYFEMLAVLQAASA